MVSVPLIPSLSLSRSALREMGVDVSLATKLEGALFLFLLC